MGTLNVDKLAKTSTGAAEFTLPAADGTAGQVMQTDGSGQLSFATVSSDPTMGGDLSGTASNAQIVADAVTATEIAASTITPAQMANSAFLANRNMVINGAMQISQRATSAAAVGAGLHTVDRWYTTKTNAGTWTQTQDAATVSTAGFGYSLKMDCTTALGSLAASDRLMLSYRLEGFNCQSLKKGTASAESVTISFWVNATKTGTYVLEMWDHPNSRHIASLYTVSVTNTWEYKTVTFAGDTTGALTNDNSKILELHWYLAAGSNYTSGTLATTWAAQATGNRAVGQVNAADSTSNNFYLAGVQMEVGITATPFEYKSFAQELQACQRYYEKSYNQGQNPAGVTTVSDWLIRHPTAGAGAMMVYFKVPKRTTPTMVTYAPGTGNSGKVTNMSGGSADITGTWISTGDGTANVYWTSTGSETYVEGHWTAEAEL